jgi:capsid protein
MDTAVIAGALDLRDYDRRRREYLACGWLPPKWDWVDPLKDARAEIEQIDAGLKSRTQALAERGYDAEQVDTEIAADKAREKSLGLTFGATPPAPEAQPPSDSEAATDAAATNTGQSA